MLSSKQEKEIYKVIVDANVHISAKGICHNMGLDDDSGNLRDVDYECQLLVEQGKIKVFDYRNSDNLPADAKRKFYFPVQ